MTEVTQAEQRTEKKPQIQYIRGWAFPSVHFFPKDYVEAGLDYRPLDDDVILCSYPKTGTTWMQYIVWQILHKESPIPELDDMTYHLVPFMEMSGIDAIKSLPTPRFYKNHFPYHLMTINNKAKYIYIHRNPEDTLVSFFHFNNKTNDKKVDFQDYFEFFMRGEVSYGDFFDHVLSFYDHKNDDHLLLVSYEKLHKDTSGQVLRVAKFLGDSYFHSLIKDGSWLKKIVETSSFDYMKKNLRMTVPKLDGGRKEVDFFRKGIIGDGKLHLSDDQRSQLRKKMLHKMKNTEFEEFWGSL